MLIIPAIDLRDGRCVRLLRGDFDQETVFADDPAGVATRWAALGAQWLHVVDLDGARAGRPAQLEVVREIAACGVPVELGGGLRTLDDCRAAFAAGVSRIILGTIAVEDPALLAQAVAVFGPERVVLGVDARNGMVAVRGWADVSSAPATQVLARAATSGVPRVIYTDIERDGTLSAPNYEATRQVAASGLAVIASGGVASREQLRRLAAIPGVEAAIVGRALYVGAVTVTSPADWWIEAGKGDERAG